MEPGHEGCTYVLSGREAITYAEVADQLSTVLGRAIQFVDVPGEAARGALRDAGMPDWLVEFLPKLFGQLRAGRATQVTDAVRRLTGRDPHTFAEFARDHAHLFAGLPG